MKKLTIEFKGIEQPPSLNGAGGLMRMHFSQKKALKEKLMWIILDQNKQKIKFEKTVRVFTIRYSSRFQDWDNCASMFKLVGDALVDLEIIPDDSPKYIEAFHMDQFKAKRSEAKYVIIIEEIEWNTSPI